MMFSSVISRVIIVIIANLLLNWISVYCSVIDTKFYSDSLSFSEGNLVVVRIGDGSVLESNQTNKTFLDVYTSEGVFVNSIQLPVMDEAGNKALTLTSHSLEGMLSLSEDRSRLLLAGYDAPPLTVAPYMVSPSTLGRTVGTINSNGVVNTTLSVNDLDGHPSSIIRTTTGLWAFNGNSVRYLSLDSLPDSTIISSSKLISENINASAFYNFGSQLFASHNSADSIFSRVTKIGLGMPADTAMQSNLLGLPFSGNMGQFYFADMNDTIPGVDVLYISNISSGTIEKYSLLDSIWSLNDSASVIGGQLRGLTAKVLDGIVSVYYTTDSTICSYIDSSGYNGFAGVSPTVIAHSTTNTLLRGISLAPSSLIDSIRQQRSILAHRKRRIIYNDDGNEPFNQVTEISEHGLLAPRLLGIENSQVDAINYCTSHAWGTFSHDTRIGTVLTVKDDPSQPPTGLFTSNVTGELIAAGLDPLKVVTRFGHRYNKEVFWSFRFNDVHDSGDTLYSPVLLAANKIKQAHPEFMVGTPYSANWTAVNYLLPEVQEYTFRFIEEVCKRYDVDGIELDFFRHRVFFKTTYMGQVVTAAERAAMTALIRRIRQMTEVEGMRRGRPILISMRLPDSKAYSNDIGLDVEKWLQDGLLDMMAVSSYIRLNPWEESVALGHLYQVPVYPSLDESRVTDAQAYSMRNSLLSYRGRSMNVWKSGADGVYIFNFFNPKSSMWHELGDTSTLRGLHKDYFASVRGVGQRAGLPHTSYINIPTLNPDAPIEITPGTIKGSYIHLGDDTTLAADVKLRLRFDIPVDTSKLIVFLRGMPLDSIHTEDDWIYFNLKPGDFSGANDSVTVSLSSTSSTSLIWKDLHLQYRKRYNGPEPFGKGNLVVLRVGNGTDALTTNANPVFLDEYSQHGTLIQSVPMPIQQAGRIKALTLSNHSQEGMLTLSADSLKLCLIGYNAEPGTTNPFGSLPTLIDRTVGLVDHSGTISTCISLNDLAGRPKAFTAADSGYWVFNGVDIRYFTANPICEVYTPPQSSTSVLTAVNGNAMHIFDNQLYVSLMNADTSFSRIAAVGAGLPITSTAINSMPGLPKNGDAFQFYFADMEVSVPGVDVLYYANNTSGGIEKYSLVAGSWTHNGSVRFGGNNPRGITGFVQDSTVKLFGTSTNRLFSLTDTSGYNGALVSDALQPMVIAESNTAFRGVALAPGEAGSVAKVESKESTLNFPQKWMFGIGRTLHRIFASGDEVNEYLKVDSTEGFPTGSN